MTAWIALVLTVVAVVLGWHTFRTRDRRPAPQHMRPYRRPALAVHQASVARRAVERAERAAKAARAWASWTGTEPARIEAGLPAPDPDLGLVVLPTGFWVDPASEPEPGPPTSQEVAVIVGSGTRLVTRWQAAVAVYQLGGPVDTLCAEFAAELARLAEGVPA